MPVSKKLKDAQTQDTNRLLALQLPAWRGDVRAIPNVLARHSIFTVCADNQREELKEKVIVDRDGMIIKFTGTTLNQYDLTVWEAISEIAEVFHNGAPVTTRELLRTIKNLKKKNAQQELMRIGGEQLKPLRNSVKRLVASVVEIRYNNIIYFGHLLDDASILVDTRERPIGWNFRINLSFKQFLAPREVTRINWALRLRLEKTQLSQWLQLYCTTHTRPLPKTMEQLREASQSKNKTLFGFRAYALKSLERLKEEAAAVGEYFDYYYDRDSDTVYFFNKHTTKDQMDAANAPENFRLQ